MATRTSSQSGNWNASSTWGGAAPPGDGDDAVVSVGHTVTVTTGNPVTVGVSGATGTIAVLVHTTSTLTLNATLTLRGDLEQRRGSSYITAAGVELVFDPPVGSTYKHVITTTTGTGPTTYDVNGTAGSKCGIRTTNRGGGFGYVQLVSELALTVDHLKQVDCGSSTQQAFYSTAVTGSCIVRDMLQDNCGRFQLDASSATAVIEVTRLDQRDAVATAPFQLQSGTDVTTGSRTMTDCTFYSATVVRDLNLQMRNLVMTGTRSYNYRWVGATTFVHNVDYNLGCWMGDVVPGSNSTLSSHRRQANNRLRNTIFLWDFTNPHGPDEGAQASAGLADNRYEDLIFDGMGASDDGDCLLPTGSIDVERCLFINKCGTPVTTLATTAVLSLFNRCTTYDCAAFAVAETNGASTNLGRISNNLFTNQARGMDQGAGFVAQGAAFNLDYNGYYNQTDATNLDHPTEVPANSYLGPHDITTWWSAGVYGDADKGATDISTGDPQFVDPGRKMTTWDISLGGPGTLVNVARKLVEQNGWDYTGAAVTPTPGYSVQAALTYIRGGLAPQSAECNGTGDPVDGSPDLGAVDAIVASGPGSPGLFFGIGR